MALVALLDYFKLTLKRGCGEIDFFYFPTASFSEDILLNLAKSINSSVQIV